MAETDRLKTLAEVLADEVMQLQARVRELEAELRQQASESEIKRQEFA